MISKYFDAVAFDLDETLATLGPLQRASEALHSYMAERMPLTAAVAATQLRPTMDRYNASLAKARLHLEYAQLIIHNSLLLVYAYAYVKVYFAHL